MEKATAALRTRSPCCCVVVSARTHSARLFSVSAYSRNSFPLTVMRRNPQLHAGACSSSTAEDEKEEPAEANAPGLAPTAEGAEPVAADDAIAGAVDDAAADDDAGGAPPAPPVALVVEEEADEDSGAGGVPDRSADTAAETATAAEAVAAATEDAADAAMLTLLLLLSLEAVGVEVDCSCVPPPPPLLLLPPEVAALTPLEVVDDDEGGGGGAVAGAAALLLPPVLGTICTSSTTTERMSFNTIAPRGRTPDRAAENAVGVMGTGPADATAEDDAGKATALEVECRGLDSTELGADGALSSAPPLLVASGGASPDTATAAAAAAAEAAVVVLSLPSLPRVRLEDRERRPLLDLLRPPHELSEEEGASPAPLEGAAAAPPLVRAEEKVDDAAGGAAPAPHGAGSGSSDGS